MIDLSNNTNPYRMSFRAYWSYIKAGHQFGHTYDNFQEIIKEKIRHYHCVQNNIVIRKENIVVTAGITQALNILSRVLLCEGDEVILSDPTYVGFEDAVKKRKAKIIKVPLKVDYHQDFDEILASFTTQTKMIFVCNPNNPTGVLEINELTSFLEQVSDEIIIVIDEAYIDYVRDSERYSGINLLTEKKNVIVLRTFSKIYGLAGLRVGYVVTSEEITKKMREMGGYYMTVTAPSILAALCSLDDQKRSTKLRLKNIRERNWVREQLGRMNIETCDSESNFLYCKTGIDIDEIIPRLFDAGIMLNREYPKLRVTIGTRRQNKKFIYEIGRMGNCDERV